MSTNYDHKKIEKKWRTHWQKSGIYRTSEHYGKKKFYVLDMFPYPSGEGLHVGHPKGYIATDIYSRFKRMQGYSVLHPMGFDAFGLPAENYALKTKTNPSVAVAQNVKKFKKQLEQIGLDYDWSREINTTDPKYYKWTQWIFLQLFKAGLAYESNEPINWCPSCKTGLANEDVEDGRCERCGTPVEKKPMRQWVLKITDYAEKLLEGLEKLDWPESIKELQRNWIGRSDGALIKFALVATRTNADKTQINAEKLGEIEVFTTRADTLFGATYLVLAPEVANAKFKDQNGKLQFKIENWDEVVRYIEQSKKKAEIERTAEERDTSTGSVRAKIGVELKGIKAINPANNEEIPIFIADYVLASYGTGAIMAVPAHDERDWQFAKKYNLPIRDVVLPVEGKPHKGAEFRKTVSAIVYRKSDRKFLSLLWKKLKWVSVPIGGIDGNESPMKAAEREVLEETGYQTRAISLLGGTIESHFFAENKDVWRERLDQPVLLEVTNEQAQSLSTEEKEKHEACWLTADELLRQITHRYNVLGLERYLKGNYAFVGSGKLTNSGTFSGMMSEEAQKKITDFVGGKMVTKYKLRDWVFSRQRYWGEPIPLVFCEHCAARTNADLTRKKRGIGENVGEKLNPGWMAVPVEDLPVKLPNVKSYEPTGTGESPLAAIPQWVNVKCPKCGGKGKRETNTMPQWAGSCWYYLRYMDSKNKTRFVDAKKEKYWSPVDFYVGGAEHATRHLIYARFWHRFLYDEGFVSQPEPFKKLQHVGLIMGEDGRKMSKRWGNVINPDDVVERFGADSLRVYEMFMGPFDQAISWNTDNLVGARRFIERVWRIQSKVESQKSKVGSKQFETELNQTIKKVTEDIAGFKFNTAISQLMIFANLLGKQEAIPESVFKAFIQLMAPFAPHISEELWNKTNGNGSIHETAWPSYNKDAIKWAEVTVAVQVNGKTRGTIAISPDASEHEALDKSLASPKLAKWIGVNKPRKIVYVKGKILNIVL